MSTYRPPNAKRIGGLRRMVQHSAPSLRQQRICSLKGKKRANGTRGPALRLEVFMNATPLRAAWLSVEPLETRNLLSTATLAVATGILNSPENYTDLLTSEYRHLLGRNPDSSGLNHFLGMLENGVNPETVEAQIVNSDEYVFDHGNTQTGWITGMYQDLLGRNPDANGLNNWLNALANGSSTFAVAAGIVTSQERDVSLIRSDYALYLGRAPRTDEVVSWLTQFQAGANRVQVAAGIIASDEVFALAGKNPSTFITHTYQDVFLRTPSQS